MYPAASLLVGMTCEKLFKEPIKLKIATSIKGILIIASIVILCFPLNIRSKRFIEIIQLAPVMDQILKRIPDYEFIVYNQDMASILFYSQQLQRVKYIKDKSVLEEELNAFSAKPRFCYMREQDFTNLAPSINQKYQSILKYKDRVLVISSVDLKLPLTLP
jgi:hypothetical protein